MGLLVIVDGKVVYGDPQELKNMQLQGVRQECERLESNIVRFVAELMAAQGVVKVMADDAQAVPVSMRQPVPPAAPPEEPAPPAAPPLRRVPRHG